MRPTDTSLAEQLASRLLSFEEEYGPLPGIDSSTHRETLLEQIVESIRRIKYVSVIGDRHLSNLCADPAYECFDPLKAAILHKRCGQIDEAFWLIFLSVHFGRNGRTGWRLARDVYGGLEKGSLWDWENITRSIDDFTLWLEENQALLRGGDGVARYFGNHRKYESLISSSPSRGTAVAIKSYVTWVDPTRNHQLLLQAAQDEVGDDPHDLFDYLYRSMGEVKSFGRTGRFDYLTMVGNLGLARIEPRSAYLKGATGPLKGARLLFGGSTDALLRVSALEEQLICLGKALNIGMQALEDALCNWQKSPGDFKRFRG